MNLTGTWNGEYSYEAGGPAVPFTWTLSQRWWCRLRGTVLDGPGGMPEAGIVQGWTWGTRMRVHKLMPVARVSGEGGARSLKEHLALQNGAVLVTDPPHPPILYEGVVSRDARSAAGTWTIALFVLPLPDGKHAVRIEGRSGSWVAQRAG